MQISSINNTNFQSRNPQIRQADRFLHVINKEFPALSPSRFITYFSERENPRIQNTFIDPIRYKQDLVYRYIPQNIQTKFSDIHTYLERIRYHYFDIAKNNNVADFYTKFIKAMKGQASALFPDKPYARLRRLANCVEMSKIAKLVLKLNGIESIPVSLKRYGNLSAEKHVDYKKLRTYNLPTNAEHRFLLIPNKNKTLSTEYIEEMPLNRLKDCLIFDPWCGFVDTPENAALRYFGEHDQFVGHTIKDYMPKPSDKIYHNKMHLVVASDNNTLKIDDSACEELKKEFPELIVKQAN